MAGHMMAVAALCCYTKIKNSQFQDRNRPLTWAELRRACGCHRGRMPLRRGKPASVPRAEECRCSGHSLPLAPRWAPNYQTQDRNMSLTYAPGRIRTRDPLLRRHTLTVARGR